jgi:lipopolysaccharide export system permease protein
VTAGDFDTADTPLGKLSNKIFRPRGQDERELTLPELIAMQDTPPANATPFMMRAELHKRLITIVTLLLLPFLALPFALGRRRNQRTYRFGIALVILIAFHEVIEQGALSTRSQGTSPWLTMWLPFTVIAVFAMWRFWKTCFSVRSDGFDVAIDNIAQTMRRTAGRVVGIFLRGQRA